MIQAKEHSGWVYWEGHGSRDGYFRSITELEEYCASHEIALPQFVKACSLKKLSMDADYIIDCALDDHHEDAGEEISQLERTELQAFLDGWCERVGVKSWEITDDDVILWTITNGAIDDLTKTEHGPCVECGSTSCTHEMF